MSVFFYSDKNTFLHRFNPMVKIALLIFLFIISVLCSNIYNMLFIFEFITVFFLLAESTANIRKIAVSFILIGLMTFILWLIFYQGSGDKIFVFYKNSMRYAATMSMRFVNMLLAGILFLSITSHEEVSDGLVLIKVPYGIALAVSLSLRMVIIFISTGFTIVEAQKVRGNNMEKGGIIRRIKSYVPLLIPLILNGIKRAQSLTAALESKGFSPQNKIDIREKYSMNPRDIFAICLMGVLFIIIICYKYFLKLI